MTTPADGLIVLKVGDVLLRAPASAAGALGGTENCLCMVRPEKISVGRAGAADRRTMNALAVTVRETVFMGELIR